MRAERHVMTNYWKILRDSAQRFADEQAPTHSAALAYAMVFSLPPMLLIILWATNLFYKAQLVQEAIFTEFGAMIGPEGAAQLMATLDGLNIEEPTWWGTAIAAITLSFTASTVLVSGQKALNSIFRIETKKAAGLGIWRVLRDKIVSFAMLVTVAFILSVTLVLDAIVALTGEFAAQMIGAKSSWLTVIEFALVDVAGMTLLLAMLFRYLPDDQMEWRDTWFGALLTAILLAIGKAVIGIFIGQSQAATLYDAAGGILVFMLWVYYAAAIFLFGASFTVCQAEFLAADSGDAGHIPATGASLSENRSARTSKE